MKLNKEYEDLISEQINNLILILVNKLIIIMLIRVSRQYSYQVKDTDSETEDLIQVLLLQMITWSKIRLITDNLKLYRKINDFDFRKMKSNILNKFESNNLDIMKNKSSILSLIKDAQEFDLLCRQIFS